MTMYALPRYPMPAVKAETPAETPAAEPADPDAAMVAIGHLRGIADRLLEAGDDAEAIMAVLDDGLPHVETLRRLDTEAIDAEDKRWGEVAGAIDEMDAWLAEVPDEGEKSALSREERMHLAVMVASRGRGRSGGRRRDVVDATLDVYYGGLAAIFRAAGAVLKAAGVVTLATGKLLGHAVMAAAEAADSAIVHVAAHERDGKPVAAYDRARAGS